jgi:hypothetical protein
VVVVSNEQFLSSFPFLKSLGIETIKQVEEKLKFEGKIDSESVKDWCVTGISYSQSLIQLNLTVKNIHEEYKIIYKEGIFEHKGKKIPILKSREKVSLRNFELSVKNKPAKIVKKSENITIFPLKKAS